MFASVEHCYSVNIDSRAYSLLLYWPYLAFLFLRYADWDREKLVQTSLKRGSNNNTTESEVPVLVFYRALDRLGISGKSVLASLQFHYQINISTGSIQLQSLEGALEGLFGEGSQLLMKMISKLRQSSWLSPHLNSGLTSDQIANEKGISWWPIWYSMHRFFIYAVVLIENLELDRGCAIIVATLA
jgi:hypothetical protein